MAVLGNCEACDMHIQELLRRVIQVAAAEKTRKGRSDAAAKPHEFFKSEFLLDHCTIPSLSAT